MIYAFSYVTSLNLNVCVSLDLIFMLKNPFKKSEARYRPFLYVSIVLGVIETIVLDLPYDNKMKSKEKVSKSNYISMMEFKSVHCMAILSW